MFRNKRTFNDELQTAYAKQFKRYGATPEGSYWFSKTRQNLRFEIMIQEVIKLHGNLDLYIGDIGCGYGALAEYIAKMHYSKWIRYCGYDISKPLIDFCHKTYDYSWAEFVIGSKPLSAVDICMLSGTFNLAVTKNALDWENHIFNNLTKCWIYTKKTLIFNLQTSEISHISDGNIFYANKIKVLNRCKALFGPSFIVEHEKLPFDTTFIIPKNNMG